MGTVADKLNKVLNTKKAIKQALIDKGVEVKDTDTFASYPDKITEIQTGGGGDMWEQIGYKAPPKFIDDGVKYSKEIYDNWDASITNRMNAFKNNTQLVYFPLVDTSNVTDMRYMFYGCTNLQYVPNIVASNNVTDISELFYNCSNLTLLDLSNFNTSNVTNMVSMFSSCRSLTSLDVSNFNTSNVITMSNMFNNCSGLTSINFGDNFDTSKVTSMSYMFSNCSGLTSINFGDNFDTSNVTNMGGMFNGCSGLISLDLSSWNTSKVTSMSWMFSYCSDLTSLDLSSWDTSNVTDMSYMFYGCTKLQRIDGCFDWSKIRNFPTNFIYYHSAMIIRYFTIKNLGTTGTLFNFNNNSLENWGDNTEEIPDARQSLVDTFVNYTYDRVSNGMGSCTIQLNSKVKARLTNDEIAAITAKGFTVT